MCIYVTGHYIMMAVDVPITEGIVNMPSLSFVVMSKELSSFTILIITISKYSYFLCNPGCKMPESILQMMDMLILGLSYDCLWKCSLINSPKYDLPFDISLIIYSKEKLQKRLEF